MNTYKPYKSQIRNIKLIQITIDTSQIHKKNQLRDIKPIQTPVLYLSCPRESGDSGRLEPIFPLCLGQSSPSKGQKDPFDTPTMKGAIKTILPHLLHLPTQFLA